MRWAYIIQYTLFALWSLNSQYEIAWTIIFLKIRLDVSSESSARQRIHLKHQALFSSKDKSKTLKCRLLQFLFGAFRVKMQREQKWSSCVNLKTSTYLPVHVQDSLPDSTLPITWRTNANVHANVHANANGTTNSSLYFSANKLNH